MYAYNMIELLNATDALMEINEYIEFHLKQRNESDVTGQERALLFNLDKSATQLAVATARGTLQKWTNTVHDIYFNGDIDDIGFLLYETKSYVDVVRSTVTHLEDYVRLANNVRIDNKILGCNVLPSKEVVWRGKISRCKEIIKDFDTRWEAFSSKF